MTDGTDWYNIYACGMVAAWHVGVSSLPAVPPVWKRMVMYGQEVW